MPFQLCAVLLGALLLMHQPPLHLQQEPGNKSHGMPAMGTIMGQGTRPWNRNGTGVGHVKGEPKTSSPNISAGKPAIDTAAATAGPGGAGNLSFGFPEGNC
jgi:hypothetical protein